MMERKILALDIDGTLTNSNKEVTPLTLKKIKEIQGLGHIVAIASGRPLPGIKKIADTLELEKYGGYVLAFNGGRIVNYKTGEVVYQAQVPHNVIMDIYDYIKDKDASYVTYENDTVITGTGINEYTEFEARLNFMPLKKVDNFIKYVDFPVNKCLIGAQDETAAVIEKELNEKFGDRVTIFRSEPFFVEIMPKDVHKATSLEKLLGILKMDRKDLIACGDGYNDLTMIEYAGVGVAMANAQQVVKDHADYITRSNEEDGIADVIDKFIL